MSGLLAIALLFCMVLGTVVVYLYRQNKNKDLSFQYYMEEIKELKKDVFKAHVLINKLKVKINEYQKRQGNAD